MIPPAHSISAFETEIPTCIFIANQAKEGKGSIHYLRGCLPSKNASVRRRTSSRSPESFLHDGVLPVSHEGNPLAMASSEGYRASIKTIVAQSFAWRIARPTL